MTLLLFPLKVELEFFIKHFKGNKPQEVTQFGHSPVYHFPEQSLLCAFAGQGKVQFALHAQAFGLARPEIQTLICVGSAGALVRDLAPGQVVIGEATIEHDFKVLSRELEAPKFSASQEYLALWKATLSGERGVRFGIIASGDEDVMSKDRGEQIHKLTRALCVAWEGAGAARAAKILNKSFLEIRGITDVSGPLTRQEFEKNLEAAMAAVAKVVELGLPR